jgi:hypothetical protein
VVWVFQYVRAGSDGPLSFQDSGRRATSSKSFWSCTIPVLNVARFRHHRFGANAE